LTLNVTVNAVSLMSTVGSRTGPVPPPLQPSRVTYAVNDVDRLVSSGAEPPGGVTYQTAVSPRAAPGRGTVEVGALEDVGVGLLDDVGGSAFRDGLQAATNRTRPTTYAPRLIPSLTLEWLSTFECGPAGPHS